MNATRPLAIALAVLVVATGVAAAAGPGIADRRDDAPDAHAGRVQVDASRTNDSVTLTVRHRGQPLEGAIVAADGSQVGTTDASGTVTVPVADRLTVRFHDGVTDRRVALAVTDESVRVVHAGGAPAAEAVGAAAASAISGDRDDAPVRSNASTRLNAAVRSADPARTDASTGGAGPSAAAAGSEQASDETDAATRRGPPVELPEQVPDRVRELHRVVQSFLDGTLDGALGESLRTLGGQPDADGAERPEHAGANETAA